MELVLATGNRDKQQEIIALLHDLDVTIRTLDDFPAAPAVIEDGDTCHARFVTVVALADPTAAVELVEGVLHGRIATHGSGDHGFGYDPVFVVPDLGKTLAELTLDQKNRISHRGQALVKAKAVLKRKLARDNNVGA